MKKLVLGIIAALVIIAFAVPFMIPGESLKKPIMEWAQVAIGHKININGPMELKVFPSIGVYVEDVTVHGEDFTHGGEPLLAFKSMRLDVGLFALLRGEIAVKSLVLDEPKILLKINKAGQGNWRNTGITAAAPDAVPAKADTPAAELPPMIRNLMLEDVRLVDGSIHYVNQKTQETWQIKKLNLVLSLDDLSSPFQAKGSLFHEERNVRFEGKLNSLQTFLTDKETAISGFIQADVFAIEADGKLNKKTYQGNMAVRSPSLRGMLMKNVEADTTKLPLLGMELKSDVKCNEEYCHFTSAALSLDDLEATGDVKINYAGKIPSVDVKLTTKELDLTPFLPPAATTAPSTPTATAPSAFSKTNPPDAAINATFLNSFNATANIKTDALRVNNIKIGKTVFNARLQSGHLATDITDAEFYGGKGTVVINIDSTNTGIDFDSQFHLRGIQMEPFLKDAEVTDRFSGTADMQTKIAGRGNSKNTILQSLSGNGTVKCLDGSIKGVDIASMVRNIQSAYKTVDKSSQKTDFAEMGGTFTINQGIATNNDLAMKAPFFRVTGAGQVDLPRWTINYRLKPQFVDTLKGQGGAEKQGLGVGVIIEGSLDNPSYRPDLESALKEAIQNPEKVKETIGTVKEHLKENKDALKELKGLFKKK